MSMTTTVTPGDIATSLGRNAPDAGSVTESQWQMHIDDALMWISDRADNLSVTEIDQGKLDYVIREAVRAHVLRPEDVMQVSTSVDDASVQKTYASGRGRVTILDEWWSLLGLVGSRGRAFEIDTMPSDGGLTYDEERLWVPLSWDA